tara:strand:- start:233 stop:799 length:567 start_codon:yes stop_codon:yes gene_type:complete
MSFPAGFLFAHGAGSDRNHSTLVSLDRRLQPLPVERVDFPYRSEGRRIPDRPERLVAFLEERAALLADRIGVEKNQLILGGRSMGGRMCSIAVAQGFKVAGLILLSYPLHPPRKPEKLRTSHFGSIDVPCLFVSGDKDPFGSPEEFLNYLPVIAGPVTSVWLENARHDMSGHDESICDSVVAWLDTLE